MVLIDSEEQFKNLVKQYKKKGTLTNCLIPSASNYGDVIKKGKMQYDKYEGGIAMYVDEGNYYRLLYFLDPDIPALPDFENYGKPLLIEEIDSAKRREEYILKMLPRFEEKGFYQESKNHQIVAEYSPENYERYEKIYKESLEYLEQMGYRPISHLNDEQARQTIELWKTSLKPTDIPEDHFHFMEDENQRIIAIVDKDDNICSVSWWEIQNNVCEVRHTVTHPNHYRKNLGGITYRIQIFESFREGCKIVYSFVEENNYRCLGLIGKLGIYGNDKICYQLIKNPNGGK